MSTVQATVRRHRVTSTVGAFCLMSTVSLMIAMGFLVEPGAEAFDVSVSRFLVWSTVFTLCSAVGYVAVGRLALRVGIRAVVIGGGAVAALTLVAMSFTTSLELFYALGGVLGLAWAGCTVLASTTIVTGWHTHGRRGTVLGVVGTGTAFGIFTWGVLFPPVIEAWGFRGGLLVLAGLVTLLALVPGLVLIRNPPPATAADEARTRVPGPRRARRDAVLAGYGLVTFLFVLAAVVLALESAFLQVMPAVFSSIGFGPTHAGALVSLYAVSGLVAKPVLGYLHDRLPVQRLYLLLGVVFVVSLPGIALLADVAAGTVYVLLPLAALAMSFYSVVLPLVVVGAVGHERFPVVYGFVSLGTSLGLALGVPIWGLAHDATGTYDIAMFVGGAGGVGALVLIGRAAAAGRRAAAREASADAHVVADADVVAEPLPDPAGVLPVPALVPDRPLVTKE